MIRQITREDITPQYLELLCQLSGDVRQDVKTWLLGAKFWAEYSNSDCQVYVYEHEGEIVGTSTVFIEHKLLHYGSRVGHIEDVVVSKEFQGQKIGEKIIKYVLKVAEKHNCYKTILDCSDDVKQFYEKIGFKYHSNEFRFDHN